MSHVPAPDDLAFAGVHDLLAAFERGDVTPTAVLAAQEERLERLEPILRCYVTHDAAGAAAAAQAADERWARGDAGPLLGITLGVKDLYDVEGLPTTGGSRAYGHEPAARDAAAVAPCGRPAPC